MPLTPGRVVFRPRTFSVSAAKSRYSLIAGQQAK